MTNRKIHAGGASTKENEIMVLRRFNMLPEVESHSNKNRLDRAMHTLQTKAGTESVAELTAS